MNWTLPVGVIERRLQGKRCSDPECDFSLWRKWRQRHGGVFLNGEWYCGEECLKRGIERAIVETSRVDVAKQARAHRLPMGLLMVSRGVIDASELASALARKALFPEKRIGECLRELGVVKEGEITRALGIQSCSPVLLGYEPEVERVVPLRLQEVAEAFCFHSRYNPAVVLVGFAREVDPALVGTIQRVLGTKVEACILSERVVRERLADLREMHDTSELVFEGCNGMVDVMRSLCSYARQAATEQIRIASARQYVWARLQGRERHDLLFRLHSAH